MRSILSAAAVAGLLAFSAACDKAATAANGPLTGTWRYRAVGLVEHRPNASATSCDVDITFDVTQNDNVLSGLTRAADTHVVCRQPGQPEVHLPTETNPWQVDGEVQDGRVHFSLAGNYHSFGEVHPQRITGVVEGYWSEGGSDVVQVDTMGSFVLERVR